MNRVTFRTATLCLALVACGPNEPRFGVIGVSAAAPRATLSGRTSAQAGPALELSPGCPGFVDPATPEHLLRVTDGVPVVVSASSTGGPLAVAVAGEGEVRCDSDAGSGHRPHVTIEQPGEYLVYVGALSAALELPYELIVAPASDASSTGAPVAEDTRVSVTITSSPSGATVRTPEGEVLGTTPAMFVLPVSGEEVGRERRFVLEMPGHRSAEVTGRLLGGSMVLHAALLAGTDSPPPTVAPVAPANVASGELSLRTTDPARSVRDYTTVEQSLEVTEECTIGRAALELELEHSYVADLRVTLRAPSGTEVVVHNHQSGSRRSLSTTIDWDERRGILRALAGQSARGRWTLVVRDTVGADNGTLTSFAMHFTCVAPGTALAPITPSPTPRGRTFGRAPRTPSPSIISPWAPRATPTPAPTPPAAPPRPSGRNNPRPAELQDPWQ